MSRYWKIMLAALALFCLLAPATAWDYTIRASVSSDGTQGNERSYHPSLSSDGRYVAYYSEATNLVSGDTNGDNDVFLHDRVTRQTTRVSVNTNGTQGNANSEYPAISGDGRYIAFTSGATTLVTGDTNGRTDVFLHDRVTRQTTLVSVSSGGTQGNGNSDSPAISGNGRYVAFVSSSTNLVSGGTNGNFHIFVKDTISGTVTLASASTGGTQGNAHSYTPAISEDDRFVVYASDATNLISSDSNGQRDIFLYDRDEEWTMRVSYPNAGGEADGSSCYPSISGDGRFVTYWSYATNLVSGDSNEVVDVFLYDAGTMTTTRVSVSSGGSQGNGVSWYPVISGNGKLISFHSQASNLVAGDTNDWEDVFMRDKDSGIITRVSVATGGIQGDYGSHYPSISSSGQHIAFSSTSTNLVPGDTNYRQDIFIHSYPLRFFAVFRPSASDNWIYSMDLAAVMGRNHFGTGTDRPLVADLNDDGTMDRAVFRNGEWIMDYSMDGSVNWRPGYGTAGDLPLAGYINNNRIVDWAVFRNGQWIVDYSMDGSINSRTMYGVAGDIPLIADFNNDGNPDRAVFRSGQWIIDYNRDGTVDSRTWYGIAGDIPLAGDFNCDGVMDRAVFRNGQWIFDYSMDGSVDWRPRFGTAGDIPLMWWQG